MITTTHNLRNVRRVLALSTLGLLVSLSTCDAGHFRTGGVGKKGWVADQVRLTGERYGEQQQLKRWTVDMNKVRAFNRELIQKGCDTDASCEGLARKHGLDPEMLDAITDCENGNRRACRQIGNIIQMGY